MIVRVSREQYSSVWMELEEKARYSRLEQQSNERGMAMGKERKNNLYGVLKACMGLFLILILGLGVTCPDVAFAQGDLIVYPDRGQSPRQQDKDTYECSDWAQNRTGFDPAYQPAQRQQAGTSGADVARGAVGGAAVGAAGGAVGGAIAGNPGKGAAIGAGAGAVLGGLSQVGRGRSQAPQEDPEYSRRRNEYNRAFAACMEGHHYTVK